MKTRTIALILRNKFNAWVNSIKDEALREDVQNNSIITGGAITSMLLNEEVSDFDVYFTNYGTVLRVAEYYVNQFKELSKTSDLDIKIVGTDGRVRIQVQSVGIAALDNKGKYDFFELDDPEGEAAAEYMDAALKAKEAKGKGEYQPIFLSGNAITLSNDMQLILRFYGAADEIHKNYDFVHCTNYWTSVDSKLHLRKEALECTLTKELKYTGSRYPVASVIRSRKFIQRGWSITAGQYLKMLLQASELDFTNVSVLQDQLMGVDLAYFRELIAVLSSLNQKEIDNTYLAQLIDELLW